MLYVRAVIALALPVLADVIVPAWFLNLSAGHLDIGAARFFGAPLIAAGCWLLLDSVLVRFAHEGRGTLAPIDPPRFVVRGGAYRVVRNPMYVANISIVTGSGVLFQSWLLFLWAGVLLVAFHLFVIFYEEPTLHRFSAMTTSPTGDPSPAGSHTDSVAGLYPDDVWTPAISKAGGQRPQLTTHRRAVRCAQGACQR